jgi:hypothetical protein
MAKFPSLRRRWRGAPLGGPLQSGCKFCLTAYDGEAKTHEIAAWLRPEMAYRGGKPSARQMIEHARGPRSWASVIS